MGDGDGAGYGTGAKVESERMMDGHIQLIVSKYSVRCGQHDCYKSIHVDGVDKAEAAHAAAERGWKTFGELWYCPECFSNLVQTAEIKEKHYSLKQKEVDAIQFMGTGQEEIDAIFAWVRAGGGLPEKHETSEEQKERGTLFGFKDKRELNTSIIWRGVSAGSYFVSTEKGFVVMSNYEFENKYREGSE